MTTHRPWGILLLGLVSLICLGALAIVLLTRHDASSSAQVVGSGEPATQVRAVPPFTAIDLRGSNNVIIGVGAPQRVVVHADSNLLSFVTTRVTRSTLVIGNEQGSFGSKSGMRVEVVVPSIRAITLFGAGNVIGRGAATRLDLALPGSGNLFLANLAARDVRAVLSGSGTIHVTATHSLDARITGSGVVFYRGRPAHLATTIRGSGTVVPG